MLDSIIVFTSGITETNVEQELFERMDLLERAEEFENRKHKFITTSDRIIASREVKGLILEINNVYKETKNPDLMDLMKRLTVIKQRIEKRLKGKPLTS